MTTIRKLNLFVVDDDPSIIRLADKYLRGPFAAQVTLSTFSDPQLARQTIEDTGCDVLISDIQMPGLDGLEMLRIAKQRNAWTQVIFMTAYSTWDCIAAAIEAGACDYLLKPLHREDMNRVVEQSCERLARWQKVVRATWQQPVVNA
jgi:DNA-binding NtrC family response regulator